MLQKNHKWVEDAINQPVKQVVGTINKPMVMEKKLNKGRPQQAEKNKYSKHWYPRPLSKETESHKHFDSSCGITDLQDNVMIEI